MRDDVCIGFGWEVCEGQSFDSLKRGSFNPFPSICKYNLVDICCHKSFKCVSPAAMCIYICIVIFHFNTMSGYIYQYKEW